MKKNLSYLSALKADKQFISLTKYVALVFCFLAILPLQAQKSIPATNAQKVSEAPVDLVNPLIASDRCRNFFMTAAARPFGMVKLAPDTEISGYYHTGYQNAQTNIFGFSHIHEFQMGGLVVMPVTGKESPAPGAERWKSSFDPAKQTVAPGYQKLHLDRYDIDVELTATKRVGFHRYTYKRDDDAAILIPFTGLCNEARMFSCDVKRLGMDTIQGSMMFADSRLSTDSRMVVPTQVFFVITTDKPFKSLDGWRTQEMVRNITGIKGENSGLVMNFGKVNGGTTVQMKVAISYCSVKQALLNLNTEAPNWNFEAVRQSAREEWNTLLSRIEVEGSHDRKVKLYTGLWHSLLGRGVFSDVNGLYPVYRKTKYSEINDDIGGPFPVYDKDMYTEIKSVPLDKSGKPLFEMHVSDSFWWSQQNLNSLWGLAYPDVLRDFCNSWLRFFDDTGVLPMGATVGRVCSIMSGQQAAPLLGRAVQMNLPGVDANHAFEAMNATMRSGTNRWSGDVDIYTRYGGWMPADLGERKWSVSRTLENNWCDWVLSQVAQKIGNKKDAEFYNQRSSGWKHLYNPESGWIQPRNSDDTWYKPFKPLVYASDGFLETFSAVMTWFPAQYDLEGTMKLMGGREKTIQRLNEQFEKAAPQKYRYGWLQYENNTGFYHAHLFNMLGDPAKTQHWVREVYNANYSGVTTSNTAFATNDEDQGMMGSLSALMSMGLFQMKGGCEINPGYEFTAPMFNRIVIHLQPDCYKAKDFVITAGADPEKNEYIESATMNGRTLKNLSITQDQISKGAVIDFKLSSNPNPNWLKSTK
jgi:putative alpha-1,2-mannosidase